MVYSSGGTADISAYENLPNGQLREIMKANGGPWGAIYVDRAYVNFLKDIYGNSLEVVRCIEMSDFTDILREFELKKMKFYTTEGDWIKVRLPLSLTRYFKKKSGKRLEKRIAACGYGGKVKKASAVDKLLIHKSLMQEWLDRPINDLIKHLRSTVLCDEKIKTVKSVLLVGGFSECEYVQEKLKDEMKGKKVLVPLEAGSVVLKGAVKFGHKPSIIQSRIMSHSYGLDSCVLFDEKIHEISVSELKDGMRYVRNCFTHFVRANERVAFQQEYTKRFFPMQESQTELKIEIFRTTNPNPGYTTEPGCEKLGDITIPFHAGQSRDENLVFVSLIFGDTELNIRIRLAESGEEWFHNINCLK